MAWKVIHNMVPMSLLKDSFLFKGKWLSSSCTGAYTVEMAATVVSKTVNDSGLGPSEVRFRSSSCHEAGLAIAAGIYRAPEKPQ